ncbi:MAG: calcium/sodium antiporter, partial [Myxococcales bacterium]|nr:calcium/sodium antiporter [Myxococcales bacterium]
MWLDLALLGAGGLLLYFGAEWLIRGAAGIARSFGVPAIVVGLTVVAYGTSAPELVVTTVAALQGSSDVALGNVVGSNIANLALILGVAAVIYPPRVDVGLGRREVPVLVATTVALPLLLLDGQVSRLEGAVLLVGGVAFTWFTLKLVRTVSEQSVLADEARQEVAAATEAEVESRVRLVGLVVVGLGALAGGGKLFVDGAVGLARDLGVSERLVGLTIVAVGTSLPELATTVVAALRRHSDIAVGNVVGSNIFNVLLVLGGAASIHPVSGDLHRSWLDLVALGVVTALGAVSLRTARRLPRAEG